MPDQLNASEALFAFCGALTSREEKTVMSAKHDAGKVADLIKEFCELNDLDEPREGWEHKFKSINQPASQQGD
jgi:uncharacterized protein (DUF1919 family)